MISYIEGQVLYVETGHALVKVGSIGYHVSLNKKILEKLVEGQAVALFTHTHLREDTLELYGFLSRMEKQTFLMLISVSGIGPKLAQTILSALTPIELLRAVIDKDLPKLGSVSGIGKKTAERLSLELRDKACKIDVSPHALNSDDEAVRINLALAIRSLGFTKSESDKAILALSQSDLINLPLETLIKKTLNVLSINGVS